MTKLPKSKINPEYNLAKIRVVGVGGAGCNAISRMTDGLPRGVDLIAVNTDLQDLTHANAKKKIQIGKNATKGLGTGMNPDLGRQAAEESRSEIADVLQGSDLIFITAGFGGGTGTGASPVIAEIAKDLGILTIAVVTKPFGFEGSKRTQIAEEGLIKIRDRVDTLISIPNDRIFSLVDKDTSLLRAFEEIDEVLKNSVLGITEVITIPGTINIDFADIKTIIQDGGSAIIGVGVGSGPDRSVAAANMAIHSPLLETSIDGAKGVLFSIAGHKDLKMSEVNEIAKLIAENVDPSAKIIFGSHHDRKLKKGQIKVTLVATGFNGHITRNNVLFSALPFTAPSKKEEVFNPSRSLKALGEAESREGEEGDQGKPLFDKAFDSNLVSGEGDKKEEVWDIPAFLRKKKRKRR
ncbi:MAG: cell division protein FtsZ [Candidatus Magasanikbacteria bacterium]|nr:cell division protein FtsZ [Candidatus Magasanikbacteria bacterium]